MRSKMNKIILLPGILLLVAAAAMAQGTAPQPAIPTPYSPVIVDATAATATAGDQTAPTGGYLPGLGAVRRYSFLQPSVRVAEVVDSNPEMLLNTPSGYQSMPMAGVSLLWSQPLGPTTYFQYAGQVRYDNYSSINGYKKFANSHAGGFSKTVNFHPFYLSFSDEVLYTSSSSFGAAGMEGMGSLSSMIDQLEQQSNLEFIENSLRPDLLPNQTILNGNIARISNTALAELDYRRNPRSVVTMSVAYGLLHFDSGYLNDTRQLAVIGGYNYDLNMKESISLEGSYTHFSYSNTPFTIDSGNVSMLYTRRISGRSSLEAGAGPQISRTNVGGNSRSSVSWQGRAAVQYRLRRLLMSANANRGLTGGSGVLAGSTSISGEGSLAFQLSRQMSVTGSFGAARNEALRNSLTNGQNYNTQFVRLGLERRFIPTLSGYISYDFQRQTSNGGLYNGLHHTFAFGVAWTPRPIPLR